MGAPRRGSPIPAQDPKSPGHPFFRVFFGFSRVLRVLHICARVFSGLREFGTFVRAQFRSFREFPDLRRSCISECGTLRLRANLEIPYFVKSVFCGFLVSLKSPFWQIWWFWRFSQFQMFAFVAFVDFGLGSKIYQMPFTKLQSLW